MSVTEFNRFILLLPLAFELIFFGFSLAAMPPLLMVMIAFPAMFIIPGIMLLAILRKGIYTNALQLVVEGFFISTVMAVMLTSIMLAADLSLTSFNYSIVALSFVSILTIIGFAQKMEVHASKNDLLRLALVFIVYVVLIIFLIAIPRLFTPDENNYISSARMGILDGAIPPITGIDSNASGVKALLAGRCFWTYLLASFLGSTGLPAYQAGLIGAGFLIMTALASSLMVKNKWLSTVVFLAVTINPLLFFFSNLALNDLALSFYTVFAVLFFVRSFSKTGNNISINIVNLSYSLICVIVLALIKLNLLVFLAMWIILVCIMLKYKLYKLNRKYKILFMAVLVPVLVYELCLDLPYVISVWIFRSSEFGYLFGKFLYISPIERLAGWFIVPWWNPTASTLFAKSSVTYLDYFTRILMPESSSLLISAVILALPIFIMRWDMRKELDKIVLTSVVLLSLSLFYFHAVSSVNLSDASRYSLWMIPLWIPLALMTLKDITDCSSFRKFFPVLLASLLLLGINIYISRETGGVYVGYPLNYRIMTIDAIMVQLISMIVIIGLVFLRNELSAVRSALSRKLPLVNVATLRNTMFCLLIVVMLLSEIYFTTLFVSQSQLCESHSFTAIDEVISNFTGKESLVFANNYIYMRPYLNANMFEEGLLLPPPATREELFELIEVAPNNTLFLISTDSSTTWLEYGNTYIKSYTQFDVITPEKPSVFKLPKLNLTEPPILLMTFDAANSTTIIDSSNYHNDGSNHGALPVEGYYGDALRFDGKGYVSISANDIPRVHDGLTISFFANISQAEPSRGYMILSKGYATSNGSYHIFVWDGNLIFSIGKYDNVDRYLSVPAEKFLGDWQHFIFTYDGEAIRLFVDGVLVDSKSAQGPIRASDYDLEIGRDSERKSYCFIGAIDELQISNKTLNQLDLVESYFDSFALRICKVSLAKGEVSIFKSVKSTCENVQRNVLIKTAKNTIDNNLTITISLEIESSTLSDVTVLVATDRVTKVYPVHLNVGTNNVKFEYPYIRDPSWSEAGGPDWHYLNEPRIILIDENEVLYNRFLPVWDLKHINALLLVFTLVLVALLCLLNLKRHTKVKESCGSRCSLPPFLPSEDSR